MVDSRISVAAPDADRNPLADEIRQEIGATYFAACRKMLESFEALQAFDRTAAPTAQDGEPLVRRSELLAHAAERTYFVVVQREAMRLSGHEEFFEQYGVPEEVRKRMALEAARLSTRRRDEAR